MQMPHPSEDDNKLTVELPKAFFTETVEMCKWEGYWLLPPNVKPATTFRSSFQVRDDDVFLASTVKTGTTWLKALSLCIMQNYHQALGSSPNILEMENPHFAVPTVDGLNYQTKPPPFDLYDGASGARLLHTHLPYSVLPDSVKNSNCKIVYIARNPKDTVMSMWHFFNSWFRPNQEPFSLEKMVDCFCYGIYPYGPFSEHVVGYWEESKKRPETILFIKYEDLKSGPEKQVQRIVEFVGRPFADDGGAAEVVRMCSLEGLKNLEVNKSESLFLNIHNSSFFRKGEVGGWKNYLTPEVEMQINQMCRLKLEPFGLFFKSESNVHQVYYKIQVRF